MKTVFEDDLLAAKKKLIKAKSRGRVLSLLTLGFYNNSSKIADAHRYYEQCKSQNQKYTQLMERAEYLDDQLLQTVLIEGARISKNTFSDLPVLEGDNYPDNWEQLRSIILTRDNYECREIDASCSGPLQIHHIIPLSKGGTNKENNLITLCMYHHCLKHEHMRKRYANLWF